MFMGYGLLEVMWVWPVQSIATREKLGNEMGRTDQGYSRALASLTLGKTVE
jgi:hypothetical protein